MIRLIPFTATTVSVRAVGTTKAPSRKCCVSPKKDTGRVFILDWGVFRYSLINQGIAAFGKEFESRMKFTSNYAEMVEKAGGVVVEHKRYFFGGLHYIVA
eukprot:PhF_6_TR19125/c0_g1_i1/m.28134